MTAVQWQKLYASGARPLQRGVLSHPALKRHSALSSFPCEPVVISLPTDLRVHTAVGLSALYKPANSRKSENPLPRSSSPNHSQPSASKESGLPLRSQGLEIEIGILSNERQHWGFELLFLSFFRLKLILQSRLSNLWYHGAHILG